MYKPFKGAQLKLGKRVRRKTVSAFSTLVRGMLTPVAPTKAKPARKTPAKTVARKAPAPRKAAPRPAPRPTTARSRGTPPVGASFRRGTHVCDFGERSYKIYIPSVAKAAEAPLPLLVMLHGCKQTPEDFARGTGMNALAEEFGFLVVYPAQERRAHMSRCWNWYKPGDQGRGGGEPALIASLMREVIDIHAVDPARVYVAGLSAGASAALILAAAYPDIVAAVGAHSGLPIGAAHDAPSAMVAMQQGAPGLRQEIAMPTIVFHGDSDTVVNPRNGRFAVSRALEPYADLGKVEKPGKVAGGREFVRTMHRVGRGRSFVEHWVVAGSGHAWSGGHSAGSFTDPSGPDASREMVRFFLRHRTTKQRRAGRGL